VLVFEHAPPFVFFSSADASNPKHSKQGAGDKAVGDDTTMRQSMPSFVVEPSLNVVGDAASTPSKRTSASVGELAIASTLSAASAPSAQSK
jgi:hypothetical protein